MFFPEINDFVLFNTLLKHGVLEEEMRAYNVFVFFSLSYLARQPTISRLSLFVIQLECLMWARFQPIFLRTSRLLLFGTFRLRASIFSTYQYLL